jgi:hypothetical protein
LLVSFTLSVSFGLTGCTAIDEVTIPTKAEALLAYAREPRLIPPAEIPKRSAKAPRTMIKAVEHKPQRPSIVKPPLAETEGQSTRVRTPYPEAPPPFDERFCAECWAYPAKAQ